MLAALEDLDSGEDARTQHGAQRLAKIVGNADQAQGTKLARLLRNTASTHLLAQCLNHSNQTVALLSLYIIAHLASDEFDEKSLETVAQLHDMELLGRLASKLDTQDETVLLYVATVVQNVCRVEKMARTAVSLEFPAKLEVLLTMPSCASAAAGALSNIAMNSPDSASSKKLRRRGTGGVESQAASSSSKDSGYNMVASAIARMNGDSSAIINNTMRRWVRGKIPNVRERLRERKRKKRDKLRKAHRMVSLPIVFREDAEVNKSEEVPLEHRERYVKKSKGSLIDSITGRDGAHSFLTTVLLDDHAEEHDQGILSRALKCVGSSDHSQQAAGMNQLLAWSQAAYGEHGVLLGRKVRPDLALVCWRLVESVYDDELAIKATRMLSHLTSRITDSEGAEDTARVLLKTRLLHFVRISLDSSDIAILLPAVELLRNLCASWSYAAIWPDQILPRLKLLLSQGTPQLRSTVASTVLRIASVQGKQLKLAAVEQVRDDALAAFVEGRRRLRAGRIIRASLARALLAREEAHFATLNPAERTIHENRKHASREAAALLLGDTIMAMSNEMLKRTIESMVASVAREIWAIEQERRLAEAEAQQKLREKVEREQEELKALAAKVAAEERARAEADAREEAEAIAQDPELGRLLRIAEGQLKINRARARASAFRKWMLAFCESLLSKHGTLLRTKAELFWGFGQWQTAIRALRQQQLLNRVARRIMHMSAARCWSSWCGQYEVRVRALSLLRRAGNRLKDLHLSRAFRAWVFTRNRLATLERERQKKLEDILRRRAARAIGRCAGRFHARKQADKARVLYLMRKRGYQRIQSKLHYMILERRAKREELEAKRRLELQHAQQVMHDTRADPLELEAEKAKRERMRAAWISEVSERQADVASKSAVPTPSSSRSRKNVLGGIGASTSMIWRVFTRPSANSTELVESNMTRDRQNSKRNFVSKRLSLVNEAAIARTSKCAPLIDVEADAEKNLDSEKAEAEAESAAARRAREIERAFERRRELADEAKKTEDARAAKIAAEIKATFDVAVRAIKEDAFEDPSMGDSGTMDISPLHLKDIADVKNDLFDAASDQTIELYDAAMQVGVLFKQLKRPLVPTLWQHAEMKGIEQVSTRIDLPAIHTQRRQINKDIPNTMPRKTPKSIEPIPPTKARLARSNTPRLSKMRMSILATPTLRRNMIDDCASVTEEDCIQVSRTDVIRLQRSLGKHLKELLEIFTTYKETKGVAVSRRTFVEAITKNLNFASSTSVANAVFDSIVGFKGSPTVSMEKLRLHLAPRADSRIAKSTTWVTPTSTTKIGKGSYDLFDLFSHVSTFSTCEIDSASSAEGASRQVGCCTQVENHKSPESIQMKKKLRIPRSRNWSELLGVIDVRERVVDAIRNHLINSSLARKSFEENMLSATTNSTVSDGRAPDQSDNVQDEKFRIQQARLKLAQLLALWRARTVMFIELLLLCRQDSRNLGQGATEPFLSRSEAYLQRIKDEMIRSPLPLAHDPLFTSYGARTHAERLQTRIAIQSLADAAAKAAKAQKERRDSEAAGIAASASSSKLLLSPADRQKRFRASELLQHARVALQCSTSLSIVETEESKPDSADEEQELQAIFCIERLHEQSDVTRLNRVAAFLLKHFSNRSSKIHFDSSGREMELLMYGREGGYAKYCSLLASKGRGEGAYLERQII